MDIWSYLKTYSKVKEEHPENLETFVSSSGGELVSLHTVARALDDLTKDFSVIISTMIDLHEERLKYIVAELPEDIQAKIKQKFVEEEDDLFSEGEQ